MNNLKGSISNAKTTVPTAASLLYSAALYGRDDCADDVSPEKNSGFRSQRQAGTL